MHDYHQVLEAFADGEPVDPDDLNNALALPEGRAHFIDVLVLRGMVGGHSATRPLTAALPAPRRGAGRRWLSAAAALLLVAGLGGIGGYSAGRRQTSVNAVTAAQGNAAAPAPAPTRVIRLEPGVDWTERAGGN